MKNNYIIVHGSFGSPFGNWFPWLYQKLQEDGKNVIVPQFPIGVGFQNYDNWKMLLNYYYDLGYITETTTIIGHSIAPVFICKYLIEKNLNVKKLLFVSGFNNYFGINEEYDTVNKTMFVSKISKIQSFCSSITCFYADNDPYVKFDSLKSFADEVSTEQYLISKGGHLNLESGFDKLEILLDYL